MAENEQRLKRALLVPVSLMVWCYMGKMPPKKRFLKKMKVRMRKMVGDEKAGVCGSCLGSDMAN